MIFDPTMIEENVMLKNLLQNQSISTLYEPIDDAKKWKHVSTCYHIHN